MLLDVRLAKSKSHMGFACLSAEAVDREFRCCVLQSGCMNGVFAIYLGIFAFGNENYLVEINSHAR